MPELLQTISDVSSGKMVCRPHRAKKFAGDSHERQVQALYADSARIAGRAVTEAGKEPRFNWDRAIDRVVTSRLLGFPVMLSLFALVFWITISGANIPSRWISGVLIGNLYPALCNARWTAVGALLPLVLDFLVTFAVSMIWRLWFTG